MAQGLIVRFRPAAPWRFGPESGARETSETSGASDTVYSAVCGAMLRLGLLDEWLDATSRSDGGSAVAFSSLFPFAGEHLLLPAPKHLWPPPPSAKVRWKVARFIPASVARDLLAGTPISEDRWVADGASQCLVPIDQGVTRAPFRMAVRSSTAVDRLTGAGIGHRTGCIEFAPGAGMWLAVAFADAAATQRWRAPVSGALRLLADTGFGGEKSRGWGRSERADISTGDLEQMLGFTPWRADSSEPAYWLLSLFHPSGRDSIDWERGNYSVVERGGRIDSPESPGGEKRLLRMVEEGSVVYSKEAPAGMARDVAPEGFPHPVYRAGFALALPIRVHEAS